jgi:uncharacterized membrane protein
MRPVAHIAGIVSAILALVNVTAMFAAASWTDISPRTRLLAMMGHLSATALFVVLTGLLLRDRPAGWGRHGAPSERRS